MASKMDVIRCLEKNVTQELLYGFCVLGCFRHLELEKNTNQW